MNSYVCDYEPAGCLTDFQVAKVFRQLCWL